MSTDYTHLSKLSFDQLFARKGPNQEVQIMDSDGNVSGIGNISSTGTLSVTSVATTAGITAGTTIQATGNVTGANLSGTNTGDVTVTAVGSSPSANGASLSGQALTLQPADGTHPGVLTSGAQTIGGAKTFSGAITASNLSGTNTGDQTITLSSEASGSGTSSIAVTLANSAVIGKVLTGYTSGSGTVAATDTILQAIQKLNGNDGLKAPSTRSIATTTPLSGGGDLSADRTLSLTTVPANLGGTGVANNAASTLTISGNFGTTLTVSALTNVTLPTSGTLATRAGAESLTNKTFDSTSTLTGATAASFSNSGTITLPTGTRTLVARDTTDTLTNKTLTGNTAVNLISGSGTLTLNTTGTITVPNATDTLVGKTTSDTLTNKTLTTPTINQAVINGKIDATSAGAGEVGEVFTATNSAGNSLSTGTANNVTSITVTAGRWRIMGAAAFTVGTALTLTQMLAAISTTNSGIGQNYDGTRWETDRPPTSNADQSGIIGPLYVSVNASTSYFLNARATFSAGTIFAKGKITAERMP